MVVVDRLLQQFAQLFAERIFLPDQVEYIVLQQLLQKFEPQIDVRFLLEIGEERLVQDRNVRLFQPRLSNRSTASSRAPMLRSISFFSSS
jgi:hypothetical protein